MKCHGTASLSANQSISSPNDIGISSFDKATKACQITSSGKSYLLACHSARPKLGSFFLHSSDHARSILTINVFAFSRLLQVSKTILYVL